MKNVIRLLIVAAFFAVFALPALAQDAAAAPGPCTTDADAKAALYKKFLDNYKGSPDQQKTASDTAKEYISKYGTCPDAGDKQIATFIQNWATKYDKAVRDFNCTDAFNKKDYARAYQACNVILAAEPDNVDITLMLARAGYANVTAASPNKGLNPDAVRMARRAAELIESGKSPAKWDPFPSKDEALGFLYYEQGVILQETDPTAAAAAFIKAAQSNSTFKNESSTYTYLAGIYETNELKKLVTDYVAAFPPGNPIPDEKKEQYTQMFTQISKVQERIIDAYARAAYVLNNDPKADLARKKAVMSKLETYYKARHEESLTGLQELISSVMSRPLMLPGQEPAPTMPAANSSAVSGTDGAVKPGATAQPAATTNGAKPAATPATSGAKPAAKPRTK
jgi:hypothetical protein